MGVDKSDVLKKMREAEAIYVLMSDCTRMPFVVCDPETYDDQVLISLRRRSHEGRTGIPERGKSSEDI